MVLLKPHQFNLDRSGNLFQSESAVAEQTRGVGCFRQIATPIRSDLFLFPVAICRKRRLLILTFPSTTATAAARRYSNYHFVILQALHSYSQ